jgi:hypothetical protein
MGGDIYVTKDVFQEAVDWTIAKIGEIGKKIDSKVTSISQEQGRLSTSINNVQTQVLEKQGHFSLDGSSGSKRPPLSTSCGFPRAPP